MAIKPEPRIYHATINWNDRNGRLLKRDVILCETGKEQAEQVAKRKAPLAISARGDALTSPGMNLQCRVRDLGTVRPHYTLYTSDIVSVGHPADGQPSELEMTVLRLAMFWGQALQDLLAKGSPTGTERRMQQKLQVPSSILFDWAGEYLDFEPGDKAGVPQYDLRAFFHGKLEAYLGSPLEAPFAKPDVPAHDGIPARETGTDTDETRSSRQEARQILADAREEARRILEAARKDAARELQEAKDVLGVAQEQARTIERILASAERTPIPTEPEPGPEQTDPTPEPEEEPGTDPDPDVPAETADYDAQILQILDLVDDASVYDDCLPERTAIRKILAERQYGATDLQSSLDDVIPDADAVCDKIIETYGTDRLDATIYAILLTYPETFLRIAESDGIPELEEYMLSHGRTEESDVPDEECTDDEDDEIPDEEFEDMVGFDPEP